MPVRITTVEGVFGATSALAGLVLLHGCLGAPQKSDARNAAERACVRVAVAQAERGDASATATCERVGGGPGCAAVDAHAEAAIEGQCHAAGMDAEPRSLRAKPPASTPQEACTKGVERACATLSIAWDKDCRAKGVTVDNSKGCLISTADFRETCADSRDIERACERALLDPGDPPAETAAPPADPARPVAQRAQ